MKKFPYTHAVNVAGHRGNPCKNAENTAESFASAISCGCDMIETDIHLTKDNVLVLMHDDTVDRTTDGTGLIGSYTYGELKKLNCNPKGAFSEIVTLDSFLKTAVENNIMVNLEIKEYNKGDNGDRCRLCVDMTLEAVEKYGWGDMTVINSFDAYVLEYVHEKHGDKYKLHGFYPYDIMFNVDKNPDDYLYCACIFDDGNPENYEYLLSRGIEPWVGAGVKTREHIEKCVALGAVLATSNDPEALIGMLDEMGKR